MRKEIGGPGPFGERLLPQVVDHYAVENPDRVFGSYAISNDISQGFRSVTMMQMAVSVNHLAWWIKERFGVSNDFETLSYMGISDFRYPMFCLAAIKCGFKVLLPGSRNSVVQIKGLLQRTDCTKMVHSPEMAALVAHLAVDTALEVPALDAILSAEAPPFPFEKAFFDAQNEPILVIHSSGTTGNPKIIVMTHGTVAVTDSDRFIGCPEGRKPQNGAQFNFEGGGGFYSCFPPYHLAGLQAYLILPVFSSSASIIIGPPLLPPNGDIMTQIINQHNGFIRAFYVPPMLIDQWAQDPSSIEQAKHLRFILYGGGPLPVAVGNKLSQVTDVCQMYGSAETGQIQLLVPQKGEWKYMEWNPFEEVDMQPSIEGTFEMVLHQEAKFLNHRSLSHNFPAIKEWRSGDLFIPHPKKQGLWRYHGRIDDIIVLANSHKINPVAFETSMLNHPLLSGVLMVGTNRSQPAILLELVPQNSISDKKELLDQIWPMVESANSLVPQYGQITRSKVLFIDPEQRFLRAPKGSILRKPTAALYALEIEGLYSAGADLTEVQDLDMTSPDGILRWTRTSLGSLLPDTHLQDHDDFFSRGLDSLKVAEFTNMLTRVLKSSGAAQTHTNVSNQILYHHPTISQLVNAIKGLLTSQDFIDVESQLSIEDVVERYSQFPTTRHVILTGATGFLGSQVLELLLQDPEIGIVYCLVRSKPGHRTVNDLQQQFQKQFPAHFNKIEILETDISKDCLGLSSTIYKTLMSKVDFIIHLAWTVDFNLSLQSFGNDFGGLRSIIHFSNDSPLNPQIIFASSTAYSIDWALSARVDIVPETALPSSDTIFCSGYGKSKQVAERILENGSKVYKVPTTVLRIGQIAPATRSNGSVATKAWPRNEWVTAMIQTSKSLNLIPSAKMNIDWVPANVVAAIIKDITTATRKEDLQPFQVNNLINPQTIPWMSLVQTLQEKLPSAEVLPLREWVDALEPHDANDITVLDRYPALKLKEFFKGLAKLDEVTQIKFETRKATQSSTTMENMVALDDESLRGWCQL